MGFRFRKSFGVGPFRTTISKSGISFSAGVKGARITKKANGNTMSTVGIPGTGISYVKETSGRKGGKTAAAGSTTKKTGVTSTSTTTKVKNGVSYVPTGSQFNFIPDPEFQNASNRLGFKRCMKITGGALLRMLGLPIFGILAFDAGPWIMVVSMLWGCFYAWHKGCEYRRPYESLKQPVDFKDYDDGKTPRTFYGLLSHLTNDQILAYADIITFCDFGGEKQFNLAELNAERFEEPISKYMLDKLYEFGFLIKPVRGKYSLNMEKLEYYVTEHQKMEDEKRVKYDAFVKQCEIYNENVHQRNVKLAEKRMK